MSATACHGDDCTPITVEITHPFHPQRGLRIHVLTRRKNWGEDRVMFYNADGQMMSMLSSWTNIDRADAYTQGDTGGSWFRTDDLRNLRALVDELTIQITHGVK
ncbi:DUF5372 family protein [Pseudoduganella namucuonensis]|uniref:DUF5372 family protein n=1 Tax=Pseudoduganella namucuonensis TaxID=1035707 RepID=UPI0027D81FFD|nr:DUF5372 family protein [Pseudoduganella namucuonensis]